jgi:hypothetical protein
MKSKERYEKARKSHENKFGKSDSLSAAGKEAAYRDSAESLKFAYAEYAKEMKKNGDPIPCWF